MTEAEWLAATDSISMLDFLHGRASDRKFRLFACACCRHIWRYLGEDAAPQAVELSERFADGWESRAALGRFRSRLGARGGYSAAWAAGLAEHAVVEPDASRSATAAAQALPPFFVHYTLEANGFDRPESRAEAATAAREQTAAFSTVVRDIFGNPFRPVTVHFPWLTSTVVALADGIYADRAFDRLPILADALQDAGCDNDDIPTHLRGGGPHVRGCWAVDLVLGKE